ncbi:MAG: exodeoxyribonuclease VII large subunit, partial [Acidobacteria bacterium]|nr:exodeoxyribonuclease VII large subunit [Acidobacteriota bacterium]
IADFVADVRAPTPSAAAELLTPNRDDYSQTIDASAARLTEGMDARLRNARSALETNARTLRHLSPQARLVNIRQRLQDLRETLQAAIGHGLELWRERIVGASARLNALSPLAVLERGYAVVRQEKTGKIVRNVKQVRSGDRLMVRVIDGEFRVRGE